MYLLITIAIIAVLCFISIAVRQNILNALQAGGYIAQGIWRRIWNAAGGARWILAILFAINLMFFFLLGIAGNAPIAGTVLGAIIPIWILFFFLRPIALIPTVGPAIRSVIRPIWIGLNLIVVPCLIFLALGLWSPVIKKDLDRWSDGKKTGVANVLVKNALHSEAEAGILAYIEEDTDLLDEKLEPWRKDIQKGTRVMIISLRDNLKGNDNHEGLTEVMLPDDRGRYLKGDRGYVPSRILVWKKTETESVVSPPPSSAPPPPPVVAETPAPAAQVIYVPVPQPQYQTVQFAPTQAPQPEPERLDLSGKYAWEMSWRYRWEDKRESIVLEFRDGGSKIQVWKFISPVFRALEYPRRIGILQRTGERTFEGTIDGVNGQTGDFSLKFETSTYAEGKVWGSPTQLNRGMSY